MINCLPDARRNSVHYGAFQTRIVQIFLFLFNNMKFVQIVRITKINLLAAEHWRQSKPIVMSNVH